MAGAASRPAGARSRLDRPVRKTPVRHHHRLGHRAHHRPGPVPGAASVLRGDGHGRQNFIVLAVFALMNILLVGTLGTTIGHRFMGLQVRNVTGGRATFVQAVVRTFLLCLAIPAVIWDRDGRGLHDKGCPTRSCVRTPLTARCGLFAAHGALRSMRARVGSMPLGSGAFMPPSALRRLLPRTSRPW